MINMYNLSKKRSFWKKYNFYILLCILTVIIAIITYYRVLIQTYTGPTSDACDFLSNALVFAGQDMGYSDLARPPLFAFLLSLIFRLGYVSTNAVYILDGLLYLFGVIGLYFLLKLRLNSIWSFLGALLYATFPTVIFIMGFGFPDITSVSFTIWAFYFLILAVKKDLKYFYLAFPFAMLAFLARYNNALIIFPIFLYIFINKEKIRNIKSVFTGMFMSILLLVPIFAFFLQRFGNMFYPFITFFGLTSTTLSPENAAYEPNLLYFIEKFPSFIGFEGILIILIVIVGFFTYRFLKFRNSKSKIKFNKSNTIKKNTKLKLSIFIVLALLFVGSFGQILVYLSEILFFILSYLLYDLLKNLNIKELDVHLLFFGWFMVFFIFHSVFAIKVDRYFILMAPPVAYFLILALSYISNKLEFKIKNNNVTPIIISAILTMVLLLSATSYLQDINQSNQRYDVMHENIIHASEWLMNYDPDYKNKVIYSDIWPYFGWYLKTGVKPMPEFKDNQKFYGGVTDNNITPEENLAYNIELKNNNVDYYFCNRPELNLTYYKSIKRFGDLIIYKKDYNGH